MKYYPGSVIEVKENSGKKLLDGLFLAGNIAMSQINKLTGLSTPTLQNWVNRGWLSRPIGKKYDKNQVSRILIINILRKTFKLEDVSKLLVYVNGDATDLSDNIIDETTLYGYVCDVVLNENFSLKGLPNLIEMVVSDYVEKVVGAKKRIIKAITIICKAFVCSNLIEQTETELNNIKKENIFGVKF